MFILHLWQRIVSRDLLRSVRGTTHWVPIITQTTWFFLLSVETSLLQSLMFPKRVHVKLIFPVQKCWFLPFLSTEAGDAVACSLCLRRSYPRVGKKLQWGSFPLSWQHAEHLLHLFATTKWSVLNLWFGLSRTPSGAGRAHAKNWTHRRSGRNPSANAKPQLPLPPSNQIKVTFIWDLWKPSRLHTQIAENPAALKSISLPCFPHTLKITTRNLDECLNEANSSPASLVHFELAQFLRKKINERDFLYPQNWNGSLLGLLVF